MACWCRVCLLMLEPVTSPPAAGTWNKFLPFSFPNPPLLTYWLLLPQTYLLKTTLLANPAKSYTVDFSSPLGFPDLEQLAPVACVCDRWIGNTIIWQLWNYSHFIAICYKSVLQLSLHMTLFIIQTSPQRCLNQNIQPKHPLLHSPSYNSGW